MTSVGAADPTAADLEFFEAKVRPLLAQHCYSCHSTKAKKLQAGLYVDSRHGLLEGGDSGAAIVPGDADASLLMEAVRYETYEMPPKGKLADKEIAILEQWIKLGAPWPAEAAPQADSERPQFDLAARRQEHWVWQPISNPHVPAVKDGDWPRQELDHFLLAKLEQEGFAPAPDASRLAILRRLHLDLTGLPPTPQQIEEFLADASPNALERVVDGLLESPRFGERWGRHWLDLVRYAESRGHEFDNDAPNAFQYRDYVIRALNADVPYDQLIREHIAGDLIGNPRLHPEKGFNESVLGTGFWFLGEWVHSPVDIRKDESDRFDNMLDVMSKTFLGVTVACARCHDHKFDAISTADYYSLTGFLQSSDYRQVRFESIHQNGRVAKELASLDLKMQRQLRGLLRVAGVEPPRQVSFLDEEGVVVDYGNLAPRDFMQDGYTFGAGPRQAGYVYLEGDKARVAQSGTATNDEFWHGLTSITEGTMQDRGRLARIPTSGRTLRTPTFELSHGDVACLVSGTGHVIACVDSHRLVSGPLHGQTIQAIKPNSRWTKLNLRRYVGHRLHLEFVPAANASLSVRLVVQGKDGGGLAQIERRLEIQDRAFADYAAAAEGLLNGAVEVDERIFADFESGRYDGWAVTGDAFGDIPQTAATIADYQGDVNHRGKYFINSHNVRLGGDVRKGDERTGTLTSPPFKIDFKAIEFLVGGGSHKGKTCVNLLVDGKVVLSATGKNNNRMAPHRWDVRPFQGKEAKIQIVDDHQTGWGNIGVDHIVFVNSSQAATGDLAAARLLNAWRDDRTQLRKQVVFKSRVAPAMLDGSGEDGRVLIRGNSSKPGKVEARHFLTAVTGDENMSIPRGSGRLQLAQQINDVNNPLTARVIVNRLWHHLMGRGIVPTTDDFGVLGQRPSHPELLDHLATRFVQDGQSIKRMIRYIVLSRSYQMSSKYTSETLGRDPKNELWHYRPPKRLEGEAIRDSLLALSGRLDATAFGPPVPIHLTQFMDGRGRPSKNGPLDGAGRRSIYVSVRRNFLSPFMLAFDTPVPFSTMGRRNVSNVPAQSLILMNDPFVVQQARGWAELALKQTGTVEDRIEWMYLTAFARPPQAAELQAATSFVGDSQDVEQWTDYAHALINTKEFIFLR